jgi:hypothetical protein
MPSCCTISMCTAAAGCTAVCVRAQAPGPATQQSRESGGILQSHRLAAGERALAGDGAGLPAGNAPAHQGFKGVSMCEIHDMQCSSLANIIRTQGQPAESVAVPLLQL